MCCSPCLPAPSPVSESYLLCYGSFSSVWLCSSVLTVLLMSVTEEHYGALLTSHPPFSWPTVPVLSLNRERIVTVSLKLFDFPQIDNFSALHSLPGLDIYIWTLSPFFATSHWTGNSPCALSGLYVHLQSLFNWAFTSSAAPGLFSSAFSSDLRIATLPWNSHRYCWELKFSFSFLKSLCPILKVLT